MLVSRRPYGRLKRLKNTMLDWLSGPPQPVAAPRVVLEEKLEKPDESASYRRLGFTFAVIALSAKLARADGKLTRDSFLAFREAFPLEDEESAKIRTLFRSAWEDNADAQYVARQVAFLYPKQPGLWREMMELLAAVALADGPLSPTELRLLSLVGGVFGFSRPQLARIITSVSDLPADPLRVLGVKRGTSREEVKERYRALMRRYHPDVVASRVSYPEALAVAERRSAKISEAYRVLTG